MDFKLKVSPSLLAADYGYLADAAILAESGGAHELHLDYMDGHYVPNLSFGIELIPALKKRVKIPLISHLMISNTDERLPDFIRVQPDLIVVQEDTVRNLSLTIEKIRRAKIKPGIAINPDRPLSLVYKHLSKIDYLIILSVFPGFGGQEFIRDTLKKMEEAHKFRIKNKLSFDLGVDGGVNLKIAPDIVKTGVNVLIAGTAIYGSGDIGNAIRQFHMLQY